MRRRRLQRRDNPASQKTERGHAISLWPFLCVQRWLHRASLWFFSGYRAEMPRLRGKRAVGLQDRRYVQLPRSYRAHGPPVGGFNPNFRARRHKLSRVRFGLKISGFRSAGRVYRRLMVAGRMLAHRQRKQLPQKAALDFPRGTPVFDGENLPCMARREEARHGFCSRDWTVRRTLNRYCALHGRHSARHPAAHICSLTGSSQ